MQIFYLFFGVEPALPCAGTRVEDLLPGGFACNVFLPERPDRTLPRTRFINRAAAVIQNAVAVAQFPEAVANADAADVP